MYSSEQLFFDVKYFTIHEPDFFYSGAIYGAISEPDSSYALKKAEELYAEIRKRTTDVLRIYHNINGVLSLDDIKEIKNYLFYDEHYLSDGRYSVFDASFPIAQSWMRLSAGSFAYHDFVLLLHEKYEIGIIKQGVDQETAHDKTNVYYNYSELADSFYKKISNGKSVTEIIEEERKQNYGKND